MADIAAAHVLLAVKESGVESVFLVVGDLGLTFLLKCLH